MSFSMIVFSMFVFIGLISLFFKENRNTKNILNIVGAAILLIIIVVVIIVTKVIGLS